VLMESTVKDARQGKQQALRDDPVEIGDDADIG